MQLQKLETKNIKICYHFHSGESHDFDMIQLHWKGCQKATQGKILMIVSNTFMNNELSHNL